MYSFLDPARDSRIGGAAPGQGNVIAFNRGDAVAVNSSAGQGPTGVTVSRNAIYGNGELGINLATGFTGYPATVTLNDLGDVDTGPNNLQNFPVLTSAVDNGITTTVTGNIEMPAPASATIELFTNGTLDPSGFGEGESFAASTTPSATGNFMAILPAGLAGKHLTATATDAAGNTSEFSAGILVASKTTAVDPTGGSPSRWIEVRPNPAQAEASVRFNLPGPELASLAVFDVRGRKVQTLAPRHPFASGLHEIRWHGDDERGDMVPPGVYFLRLDGAAGLVVRKVLLTR